MQLTDYEVSATCYKGRIRSADYSFPSVSALCFGLSLRKRRAVRNNSLIKIKCQPVSRPRRLSSRRKLLDSDFSERDTSCHSHLLPMHRGEKKVTHVTRHADKNKKQEEMLSGKIKATPLADIIGNTKNANDLTIQKKSRWMRG